MLCFKKQFIFFIYNSFQNKERGILWSTRKFKNTKTINKDETKSSEVNNEIQGKDSGDKKCKIHTLVSKNKYSILILS